MRFKDIKQVAEETLGVDLKIRASNCRTILLQGKRDRDLLIEFDRETGFYTQTS